ncbi:hypothetical protein P8452_35816 [Trifolium repens]|nr:hypothetical protein P8452_35816 [Trifolium repens]
MAQKLILPSLVIFLSFFLESSLAKHNSQTITYIESSCNGTLYPKLCIRCLNKFSKSTINGPQHLAQVALSVSLSRALQTRGYLLNVAKELKAIDHKNKRMYLTVQDCVNQINDSVDQLSQAIKELKRMSKRVATIKVKAKNVAEVTSNALALFHSYASSYKQAAARATKKP